MSENITVSVSSETASKLFLAYVGLSPVRKAAVDEVVENSKGAISRKQATFNEICDARVEMYAKRGAEAQQEVMTTALQVLIGRGTPEEEARKMLGLSDE